MRLNPPRIVTFRVSIASAAAGLILYILAYAGLITAGWIGLLGVLLLAAGFILLTSGLIVKGL